MLLDDKERFVELCVENLLWGNLKIDYSDADHTELGKKIVKLSGDMARWIGFRENKNSNEFKTLTVDLYLNLVGARFSNILQGEIHDRDTDKELKRLNEENTKLKTENMEAVQNLAQIKAENDLLKSEKPLDKNFKGFS